MREPSESFNLILTQNDGLGRITVDLEAYFDFGSTLQMDLEALTASQQAHRPRPAATVTSPPLAQR